MECGDALEDTDILTVYIGVMPGEEYDDDVEHEYWCEECYYAPEHLEKD